MGPAGSPPSRATPANGASASSHHPPGGANGAAVHSHPARRLSKDAAKPVRSSPLAQSSRTSRRSCSAPDGPVLLADGTWASAADANGNRASIRHGSAPTLTPLTDDGLRLAGEAGEAEAASPGASEVASETPDEHGNTPRALAQLARTVAVLEEGIERLLHTGAQVSVRVEGGAQYDIAVGEVRPGVPMDTGIMANWMSTSKVVAVVAIFQQVERGKLKIGDRICKYLPAFGRYGKELITLEHLLVHTAGIPYADVSMWSAMHKTSEVRLRLHGRTRARAPRRPVLPCLVSPTLVWPTRRHIPRHTPSYAIRMPYAIPRHPLPTSQPPHTPTFLHAPPSPPTRPRASLARAGARRHLRVQD